MCLDKDMSLEVVAIVTIPYISKIVVLDSTHLVCFDVSSVVHVFSYTLKLSLKVICLVILKGALYARAGICKKLYNLY